VAPPSLPSPPPVTREESLFVVHEEPKRIELTITGEQRAVSSDDEFGVIEYDGAHRDLRAQTSEGELPEVDGLRLEHTEFSFDTATAPAEPLEVENFRAAEPFRTTYSEPATEASAQPTATDPEDVFAWDVARPAESDEQQPSARATPRSLAEIEDGVSWAPPAAEPVGIDARHAVADSLERVARRIRAGEIALSPDAHSGSDAAAIAAALTALLRMPG
jgi:hypothetical protein